jgi:PKD repeat protein
MQKKRLLFIQIILLLSIPVISTAQTVTYSNLPRHLQFFARDGQDSSVVSVSGTINTTGYDSLYIKLYKSTGGGTNLVRTISSGMLNYSGSNAPFSLQPKIHAELAEYKVELYAAPQGTLPASHTLIKTIDSLVCGDAFIIAGQSNSHPSDALATYENEYCRTLGIQTFYLNYSTYDPKDTLWGYANGHGFGEYFTGKGLVGVWGIRLMQYIRDSFNIPVCIINGGAGGSTIDQNLPLANHEDLTSIYGRLLYRVKKAGLQNGIRGIFWYQGEGDVPADTSIYSPKFNTLYNAWKTDYSSVNKLYVMQLHHGCAVTATMGGAFREHQRKLKYTYPDIQTMSTMNLPGHDGCHYYKPGYDTLAERLFRLVARDFYGSTVTSEINAPDVAQAYYADAHGKNIRLLFNHSSNLSLTTYSGQNIKDYFYLNGLSGNVDQVSAQGNIVTLRLATPATGGTITYSPDAYYNNTTVTYQGPYIINPRNIGALTFHGKQIGNNTAYAPPVANYGYNSSQSYANNAIALTDSSLEWPTSYTWQAPGGVLSSTSIANPTVTYSSAGTYAVTLTVVNAFGSSFITKQIIVTATSQALYVGGSGRGEIMGSALDQSLSNNTPNGAFRGSSGRGDVMSDAINNALSVLVAAFRGGSGRGEIMTSATNLDLNNIFGPLLPLRLVNFDVTQKDCNALVEWTTGDEDNVNAIELEQSKNGKDFIKVASIASKGAVMNNYQYTIAQISGKTYYRLKMINNDNSSLYSSIKEITTDCSGNKGYVKIFPNPAQATSSCTIHYKSEQKKGMANLILCDEYGRTLWQSAVQVNSGTNIYSLPGLKLAQGIYFIYVGGSDWKSATQRLTIIK